MMKFGWFEERTGDGPYQWVTCGFRFDITDHPLRDLMVRDAERQHAKMIEQLSTNAFDNVSDEFGFLAIPKDSQLSQLLDEFKNNPDNAPQE